MPKIDDLIVQRVIDAARIEDVVGEFVTLRKAGVNLTGLCPFHDDRRAGNFIVRPSTISPKSGGNTYRCFACDKRGGPVKFLMDAEGMTFPDAIKWLGHKYSIPVDDVPLNWTPPPPRPVPPPLPALELSRDLVLKTMHERTYATNFITWLWQLPWSPEQRNRLPQILWDYCVGGWPDGRVVFWQIDNEAKPRAAKLMKFYPQEHPKFGHRDKEVHPGWIYNQEGIRQEVKPDEHTILKPGFGFHLLSKYPQAEVQVVESEKTALLCAIYFGDLEHKLWVATAGKANLGKNILKPLTDQNRVIALHPDRDGIDEWREFQKGWDYKYIYVTTFATTVLWKPEDGDKADIADVLVRLMNEERRDKKITKISELIPRISPATKLLTQTQ